MPQVLTFKLLLQFRIPNQLNVVWPLLFEFIIVVHETMKREFNYHGLGPFVIRIKKKKERKII